MIYILMLSLILLCITALIFSKGDILSPWVIACAMFIFSTGVVLFNVNKWGSDYNLLTIIVIFSAILFLGFGELFSKIFIEVHRKNSNNKKYYIPKPIKISKCTIRFVAFVMVIVLVLDFIATYRLSIQGGNSGGFNLMLKYARYALVTLNLSKGSIVTRLISLNKALGYFFIYVFLYNKILFDKNTSKFILAPVLIYIGTAILSTGRTEFMRFIIFIVIIAGILYKYKNGWSNNNSYKIIKRASIGMIAFFAIFTFAGRFVGKGIYNSPLEVISYYSGSSIYLLDKYLLRHEVNTEYFGSHTLYGFYNILRKIGFDIPMFTPPLEMAYIPHFYSNLYTALRRYIQDFNYGGMLFIQFCLGVIYGGSYNIIRRYNRIGLLLLCYAALFYPIVELAIEERFLIDVMTFTTIFWLLLLIIIYKILVKKND